MNTQYNLEELISLGEAIVLDVFEKCGGLEALKKNVEKDLQNQKKIIHETTQELESIPLYQGTPLYLNAVKKYQEKEKHLNVLLSNEFLGISQTPSFISYLKKLFIEIGTVKKTVKPYIHEPEKHIETINLIQRFYPDEWIRSSNSEKLYLRHANIVARYINYPKAPTIFTKAPNNALWLSDVIHEYAHRVEITHPNILELENQYLDLRCSDKLVPYVNILGQVSEDENVRENDFLSHYIGKEYPQLKHKEVLSMGMEILICGSYGGFLGLNDNKEDLHMQSFIVGLLANV